MPKEGIEPGEMLQALSQASTLASEWLNNWWRSDEKIEEIISRYSDPKILKPRLILTLFAATALAVERGPALPFNGSDISHGEVLINRHWQDRNR